MSGSEMVTGEGVPQSSPVGLSGSIRAPLEAGGCDLRWTSLQPWSGFLQQHRAALQAEKTVHWARGCGLFLTRVTKGGGIESLGCRQS